MSYRSRKSAKRRGRRSSYEDVDPLNYVSNLSDVMLILAVGIMLSLILHWNVPVGSETAQADTQNEQSIVTFSDDDLSEQGDVPDNVTQIGNVYYDEESGTYYILPNQAEGGENG